MSVRPNAVCFLENPLLDISVNADQALLDKYGLVMNNAILAEAKHAALYTEIVGMNPLYVAGGAAQNSARVAQWMLQKPGSTNYMGCIGRDAFGDQLAACLAADGVGEFYMRDEKTPTGTCAVLVKDHERSLCTMLNAANNFKPSHLAEPRVESMWKSAEFIYIGGYFFTVSQESIMTVAAHCNASNVQLAINLSAPFIPQFFGNQVAEVMPFCDFVFGNESEAAAYGAAHNTSDPEAVARIIANQPKANNARPRVCVITQGSTRTIVAVGGINGNPATVFSVDVPPVPKAEIVDTNGQR
jgi:adenosine kinase